jgi:hypothetical protein
LPPVGEVAVEHLIDEHMGRNLAEATLRPLRRQVGSYLSFRFMTGGVAFICFVAFGDGRRDGLLRPIGLISFQ